MLQRCYNATLTLTYRLETEWSIQRVMFVDYSGAPSIKAESQFKILIQYKEEVLKNCFEPFILC